MERVLQDVAWMASFFAVDVDATQKVGDVDGVALVAIEGPAQDFCVITSAGLASRAIDTIHPQELFLTVHTTQWEAARILVQMTLESVLSRATGLVYGDVISGEPPLLAGTTLTGIMAAVNPYLPEEANMRQDADGRIVTHFMSLLPLAGGEAAYVLGGDQAGDRDDREESLLERLDDDSVDLLDVRRPAVL